MFDLETIVRRNDEIVARSRFHAKMKRSQSAVGLMFRDCNFENGEEDPSLDTVNLPPQPAARSGEGKSAAVAGDLSGTHAGDQLKRKTGIIIIIC